MLATPVDALQYDRARARNLAMVVTAVLGLAAMIALHRRQPPAAPPVGAERVGGRSAPPAPRRRSPPAASRPRSGRRAVGDADDRGDLRRTVPATATPARASRSSCSASHRRRRAARRPRADVSAAPCSRGCRDLERVPRASRSPSHACAHPPLRVATGRRRRGSTRSRDERLGVALPCDGRARVLPRRRRGCWTPTSHGRCPGRTTRSGSLIVAMTTLGYGAARPRETLGQVLTGASARRAGRDPLRRF